MWSWQDGINGQGRRATAGHDQSPWSGATVDGSAVGGEVAGQTLAPLSGPGRLIGFELVLFGDQEAFRLGNHVQSHPTQLPCNALRRPPGEHSRQVDAG